MTEVKSPYNFVPLNKNVFTPYWAEYVSHDVPFENALCGKIQLTITAENPIFVKGELEPGTEREFRFFKMGEKYCIPGTSIKGELESVLENLSFGKLKRFNDDHFSVRDMTDRINLVGTANHCGYLIKKGNSYEILDCGKIVKIKHSELNLNGFNISNSDNVNSKYSTSKPLDINVEVETINKINIATIDPFGTAGELVFTGAMQGKQSEFVFIKKNGNPIRIEPNIVENFKQVYFQGNSEIGDYWKEKFVANIPIPIFYQKDIQNIILGIGLTQLFKKYYKNSISKLIKINPIDLDLIETIFGYTPNDTQKVAGYSELKGRVSIEPAINTNQAIELPKVIKILGSPKASYYPFYIKQNVNINNTINGTYKTFMDDDAELSGRKRYEIKNNVDNSNTLENPSDTTVTFYPLKEGAKFTTTIHYHNLRPVELGALLSAITFHSNTTCRHAIGMAKPFGYGRVKFDIDFELEEAKKYMCQFEKMMNHFYKNWIQSEQVVELLKLATPVNNIYNKLSYPILNPDEGINEFVDIKTEGKALPRHSVFLNDQLNELKIESLLGTDYCWFDPGVDIAKFNSAEFESQLNILKNSKTILIEEKLKELEILIIEEDSLLLQREIEKKQIDKTNEIENFRKDGINLLIRQKNINDVLAKFNTWLNKYYEKKDPVRNEKNELQAIPKIYEEDFIAHLLQLYFNNKKDKKWKVTGELKHNEIYKFLKKCIGEDKAIDFMQKIETQK